MKKLNRKLEDLVKLRSNGNLENFIDSLCPQAVGNFLNLIEIRKKLIIKESSKLRKEIKDKIDKEKKRNAPSLIIVFLEKNLHDLEIEVGAKARFWENIEKKLKKKKKYYTQKRKERIKSKTQ